MLVSILRAKLHRARVTEASTDYPGSIGISRELLEAVGLRPYERVLVANIENGERLETYVIEEAEPGRIVLNGAAAHKGAPGDRVIIMSFAWLAEEEADAFSPRIAILDDQNRVIEQHG